MGMSVWPEYRAMDIWFVPPTTTLVAKILKGDG